MSIEQNKANFRRLYGEVFNKGILEAADELVSPNVVEHQPQPGVDPNVAGPELVKQIAIFYRSAFPDLHINIDDLIAEGDKVVARITLTGTHQAELMGIPPTNKHIEVSSIDVIRFDGGKVVEHWGETDTLGMMQQLGVVPS